jgi:hypothetical protein
MSTIDEVRLSALALSLEQRAELASDLLLSLEPEPTTSRADIDVEWTEEIEKRIDSYKRGDVALLDWRESVEQLRQELREPRAS